MLENFKSYINTLLCLGIFITILQLIIPKNKSRKYIYSLTGIIMIITVISPIVNLLKNEKIEDGINQVLSNIDSYKIDENVGKEDYKTANENTIKNQVILKLKNDIKNKLDEKNIKLNNVEVFLEENYEIRKISLNINNLNKDSILFSNLNSVIKYINEEYKVDYSKIEVIEEGK